MVEPDAFILQPVDLRCDRLAAFIYVCHGPAHAFHHDQHDVRAVRVQPTAWFNCSRILFCFQRFCKDTLSLLGVIVVIVVKFLLVPFECRFHKGEDRIDGYLIQKKIVREVSL